MFHSFIASIYLIACHGGPAEHFSMFAEKLTQKGYEVQVYASGPAIKKFQERGIPLAQQFNADQLSAKEEALQAEQLAKICRTAAVVLTDVGHPFDISLQKALAKEAPTVKRLAYYDNPENCVLGGYSKVAAQVVMEAQKVLFANANLANKPIYQDKGNEILLCQSHRVGIGYYPLESAKQLAEKRNNEQSVQRAKSFASWKLKDKGQKILVYFGANNEEYFSKAFPAFLGFLSEAIVSANLSNLIIVLQQHPGAKSKNFDRHAVEAWIHEHETNKNKPFIIVSEATSEEMQILADVLLYYQTSMGPLFALAGIPIVQVGHETNEDILIKGSLCPSITNAAEWVEVIESLKPHVISEGERKMIFDALGVKNNWFETLEQTLNELENALQKT